VLLAVMAWGDRWKAGAAGAPLLLRHDACGELTHAEVRCARCSRPLRADEVTIEPGRGGSACPGTSVVAERLASIATGSGH
jgi:hypothetical protein